MKKFLLVATVVKLHVNAFHIPTLKKMKEKGYEIHVAARNDYSNLEECVIPYCDKYYDIPFERSPFRKNNLKAYSELKDIININEYDIIHCHTPVGGALTRLAARKTREKGTKVFYTAHGFHFYNGAPLKNWLLFYPIERILSKYTDALITINREDYNRAKQFNCKKVVHINGVGIDLELVRDAPKKSDIRKELGIEETSKVLISVGELNKNKNHAIVIEALAMLEDPTIHYLICGVGNNEKHLKKMTSKLGLENQIHFLGFRKDILNLYRISDLFLFPSFREGLSLSLMEAMASGLPAIVSNVRGNKDLVDHAKGGFLVEPTDSEKFKNKIFTLLNNQELSNQFSQYNLKKIENYSIKNVIENLMDIYNVK